MPVRFLTLGTIMGHIGILSGLAYLRSCTPASSSHHPNTSCAHLAASEDPAGLGKPSGSQVGRYPTASSDVIPTFTDVIPVSFDVIPALTDVIPALTDVIPAFTDVIPAKAGIQSSNLPGDLA